MSKLNWKKSNCFGDSVAEVIKKRTGCTLKELDTTEDFTPDGISELADAFVSFKEQQKEIYIFGDYDADGVTSCLNLSLILDEMGLLYTVYIPRRMTDGYGPSESGLSHVGNEDVLICVDNGITGAELLEPFMKMGKEVYVIDHHGLPKGKRVPEVTYVLDPEVIPGKSKFTHYCGAGLCYFLARELGKRGELSPESFIYITMLTAIGTVADVMPLLKGNRQIVKKGLKYIRQGKWPALTAALGLNTKTTSTDIGFKIAPLINASGRLYDDGGQRAYSSLYRSIVNHETGPVSNLVFVNEERKKIQADFYQTALAKYHEHEEMYPIVLEVPDCPEGVIGLMAGNLQEDFKKAAFVFTRLPDGTYKGSARTDGTMNVAEYLNENSELFIGYGGHPGAAGMRISEDGLKKFREKAEKDSGNAPEPYLYYDMEIQPQDIPKVLEEMDLYEPFGEGIECPVMRMTSGLKEVYTDAGRTKSAHYRVLGKDSIKFFSFDYSLIGFHAAEKAQEIGFPKTIESVGAPSRNYYMGKVFLQFIMQDFKKV